jgi:hypothetical protein
MTNVGESSSYYGVDAPQVRSKPLPIQTKTIRCSMVHMGYLLYNMQENNNKGDNVDAVPKV